MVSFKVPNLSELPEDDASTSSYGSNDKAEDQEQSTQRPQQLVQKESAQVFRAKLVVCLVLVTSAAVVGYFCYAILAAEQEDDFEAQFHHDAAAVLANSQAAAVSVRHLVTTFSSLYTSHGGSAADAIWPNVTLPDFEALASQTMQSESILLLCFSPLLLNDVQRAAYEAYSVQQAPVWLTESYAYQNMPDLSDRPISPFLYKKTIRSAVPEGAGAGPYSPVWQLSPPPTDTTVLNFNLFNAPTFERLAKYAMTTQNSAISPVLNTETMFGAAAPQSGDHPQSIMVHPVAREFATSANNPIVGHTIAVITWKGLLEDLLPPGQPPVTVVLKESCGAAFTYRVDGPIAVFLGLGDLHDPAYNHLGESSDFLHNNDESTSQGMSTDTTEAVLQDHCEYTIGVYPTSEYEEFFQTPQPVIFTVAVILIFAFSAAVFIAYSCLVDRRQEKVHETAVQAKNIVNSLFPGQVAEQLQAERARKAVAWTTEALTEESEIVEHNQLAEFYPSVTIMFADISGFTAWSSVREPKAVFVLLETLYKAFDDIACKRKVFKVETIGDCYVAVCGLPDPCKDHATRMCRFAVECRAKMISLRGKLESRLGPDTGDLAMRFGLHSGSVTAGVLRGERARFQLFGDAMNTASRMESNGLRDKIHLSDDTAQVLIAAGKNHWLSPREDKIVARGKGEMKTWWLRTEMALKHSTTYGSSVDGSSETGTNPDTTETTGVDLCSAVDKKTDRMINWTSELLLSHLKAVVASRSVQSPAPASKKCFMSAEMSAELMIGGTIPMDELKGNLSFPGFIAPEAKNVELSSKIEAQVRRFVAIITSMYKKHPFHNMEHACFVSMSSVKLLHRAFGISKGKQQTGSSGVDDAIVESEEFQASTSLAHIKPDPLSEFAIVFAALIHDVGHEGVPNFILAKENPTLVAAYRGKSIAEQNSVDVAWKVLMDEEFRDLRNTIYVNEPEMKRFRQVVVTAVLSTDIFDQSLVQSRKQRFERAYESGQAVSQTLKNCIVLENLMQASDIGHTMQHWHVYIKWNQRLFQEMYKAFADGRMDKDPSEAWYEGEIEFFEGIVIPLAKRLDKCGVFGVSSQECLNNALTNLTEWKERGREVVQEFKKNLPQRRTAGKRRGSAGHGKS